MHRRGFLGALQKCNDSSLGGVEDRKTPRNGKNRLTRLLREDRDARTPKRTPPSFAAALQSRLERSGARHDRLLEKSCSEVIVTQSEHPRRPLRSIWAVVAGLL